MTEQPSSASNEQAGRDPRSMLFGIIGVVVAVIAVGVYVLIRVDRGEDVVTSPTVTTLPTPTMPPVPSDPVSTDSTETSESTPDSTPTSAPSSDTSTTTAPSTSTTSSTIPPIDERTTALVAITADGDAVFFAADSDEPTLLFDGPVSEAPMPEEGPPPNVVDAVALTPDGSTAFIGTCCEPISGAILQTMPPETATYESGPPLAGYGPSVSPNGRFIAAGLIPAADSPLTITDIDSGELLDIDFSGDNDTFTSFDTMWLDDTRLAVLGTTLLDGVQEWVLFPTTFDGTSAVVGEMIVVAPDAPDEIGAKTWQFAGSADGTSFAVHQERADAVLSIPFDGGNERATTDVDAAALRVWLDPLLAPVYVGTDGSLHVGSDVIAGDYVWARY